MSIPKTLILLSIVIFLYLGSLPQATAVKTIKISPMTNEYFDKIYKITANNKINYLHISCREKDVLSVSVTQTLDFYQHPKFPVFDQLNFEKRIPHNQIPRMQRNLYTFMSACDVKVQVHSGGIVNDNDPLVTVSRTEKEGGKSIFTLRHLIQSNQNYTQFDVYDPSTKWGFGERFQKKFAMQDGMWTVYNRDRPFEIDSGSEGKSAQTYGHQPVYLARNRQNHLFHMVYFKNTFGFNYRSRKQSEEISFHSIGGNVHFLIFIGKKNPETLLRHYHDFIGGIHVPPFWSLGWHQSRWGYSSLSVMTDMVDNYNKNLIPIDTVWSDLDYMQDKAIFTINSYSYPPGKFSNMLETENLHWIPLIDVGIYTKDIDGMKQGKEMNVFLKTKNDRSIDYIARVWPGTVNFVDYLHPNASRFWEGQLDRLYEQVPFSGIWLDMNQASNFNGNNPIQQTYRIQHSESINMMTIDNDLPHYCYEIEKCADPNNPRGFFQHKEVHAYYGHLSTIPTFNFLERHGRPFIISRSNSIGTGRFAGHWTGDNNAQWDFLRLSINGNFMFQIFGIQMVGADICGFHGTFQSKIGNTQEQLCGRWMQLGSLYPFARSHNQNVSKPQEPYILGDIVKDTSIQVLRDRYSMLKQMYTYLIGLNGTGSLFRPLFFEFYEDLELISKEQVIETQFLIGKNLMSAPIVYFGRTDRTVYFPGKGQTWYDITTIPKSPSESLKDKSKPKQYPGQSQTKIENQLPAPVPLFLRGGSLILFNQPKLRSRFLDNQFLILAALDQQSNSATGEILGIQSYDNEESIKSCLNNGCTAEISIQMKESDAQAVDKMFTVKCQGKGVKNTIHIKLIRVWHGDRQWRNSDPIVLEGAASMEVEFQIV